MSHCLSAVVKRNGDYRTDALTSCQQSTVSLEAQNHQTQLNQHQDNGLPLYLSEASHTFVDQHSWCASNQITLSLKGNSNQTLLVRWRPTFWGLCALGQIQCVIVFVVLAVLFAWGSKETRTGQRLDLKGWIMKDKITDSRVTDVDLKGWYQYLWFANMYQKI